MGKKDLKGFEYIGDVPAYNNMTAQRVYLPLYVKFIKGIKFLTYRKDQFEYNAICNDYLFLMLPPF